MPRRSRSRAPRPYASARTWREQNRLFRQVLANFRASLKTDQPLRSDVRFPPTADLRGKSQGLRSTENRRLYLQESKTIGILSLFGAIYRNAHLCGDTV
jgi:hypothetical protein